MMKATSLTWHGGLIITSLVLVSVVLHVSLVDADVSDNLTIPRQQQKAFSSLDDCQGCNGRQEKGASMAGRGNHLDEKDIEITAAYSHVSGAIRVGKAKLKDLSSSWVISDHVNENHEKSNASQTLESLLRGDTGAGDGEAEPFMTAGESGSSEMQGTVTMPMPPVRLMRRRMRWERRASRTAKLMQHEEEADEEMEAAAMEQSEELETAIKGKYRYSIWRRRDYEDPDSGPISKLMLDQIITAKAYASIARSNNETGLCDSLLEHARRNRHAMEGVESTSEAALDPKALAQAKDMGRILSLAKDRLFDCATMSRKLRAMLQYSDGHLNKMKKKSAFLIQLAAKTIPRPLHCIALRLAADYFLQGRQDSELPGAEKMEDPLLHHYAIFSDNVLATSVVVNSTDLHVREAGKHVFHVVTDRINFAAMRMWFVIHPPVNAVIQVQNIDDFKWLNASYCSVLRQLESSRVKEYYFKTNNPSSLSVGLDGLKYRNPKYLSMLNHLRFYLPQVYPKLDKILFLDDDVVVQKDLTPLWSIDMGGMVNGAVETCKDSFHRFDKYLNFSDPAISHNFDPDACGWAFGMNIFDLGEWRRRDITGIYHRWQDLNEERTLWKLGTLPPGLITFYNLTHPLDRAWHALGLGYDPALNETELENAAVVHYNGNYKPWLDLAIAKYKPYWSRYVMSADPYLQLCNFAS